MQFRDLAGSDISVSSIAFGCWAIVGGFNWGPQDEQDSLAALRTAFDEGINFFDSAEGYGSGRSEELLGKALGDVRDQIVIATKVSPKNFQPADLRAACERSLRNLNTEWIDLYQLHWPRRDIPVADTLGVLDELKAAISSPTICCFAPSNTKSYLCAPRRGFRCCATPLLCKGC
jgi:myo-inositol catabolism protein IolS